ncbi:hypothetical protein M407DRAFT_3889 [Tulasnella calospora MUT 4182]|uniref:Uncharacterized protein n=1 Tax=Tulasnella calospora MUT 4182 TaxID=1051891 RepID=A0A0C3QVF1_9AGAM|nr:hypothetical protein M407DRAFT_3889 [Tulasnella calospora MUT 4182]
MAVAMNQPLYSAAGGRWYNAEILAAPHRNFMINIFLQHHASLPFDLHVPTFIARLHSANPSERPHPAIIESMYLMACYFVSRGLASSPCPLALEVITDPGVELPQLAELAQLEEHFLRRARTALVDSLSFSDRLMDFLRGSILVTQYLYLRGRFLEGANNAAGPGSQFAGSSSAVLLAPPTNQLEVAERIKTFWMVYFCDKMSSICAGFLGALPGEGDALDAITTVFPRRFEEYESGVANEAYNDTLGDLLGGVRPIMGDRLPDIPWTVALKGVSLLVRATRLGLNYRLRPTHETIHTVQGLKVAIDNFRSTLAPLESSGHRTAPVPGTSCKDSGTLLGHTAALGALMEVHHTLVEATDSDEEYDARLVRAVEVAELASSVKEGRLANGTLICAGGYVETVFGFFRPPESQLESVAALLSAASETLGEIRNQSRAGLEYALQKHKTIDIELDMQAPIIIIPEDVRTESGQHMVLDAGHISVRSDLVPKSDILAIQAKRKRQYTDKDFEELESLMYDKFFLQLESAQVSQLRSTLEYRRSVLTGHWLHRWQLVLGKDLESCLNALNSADEGRELHLLERINMEFSVQMSIIPDAPNLTRFKVAGTLPLLNVNFSNTKYKGIMRFVDISIPNFDGDTKDTPHARPSTTPAITSATRPDPFQLSSNFFRSTDRYLIDDADHSTIGGDEDSDAEDTFVDADNESIDLSRSTIIKQHTFEFSFKVEKLQASLYKDDSNGTPEKLLAELQLYRFDLDFALAKFDMQVDISLNSLSVYMVDQPGHRVPMVLSSRTATSGAKGAETGNDDLVKVRYFRVQKNSPEFHTVYEGIDQSVTASLSTLVVHAAPEPIIVLYDFIMSTFVPGHGGSQANTPVAADSPGGEPFPPAAAVDSGKIRVRVNLTTVELLLIDNDRRLATLDLSAAEVAILLRGNTMRIGGQLGNLSIVDDSPLIVQNADFKKIVSIEGDQLADFSYETFDPYEKETFPGVNSLVHLRFASLKTTFIEAPVRDIYQWLIKFARMKALYDAATQAAVQRASEISRMKFDIVVKSPIVVIPRDASNSMDVLVMKLGEIFANNSYSGPVATTSAGLRGIRLTSHFHYGDDVANLRMIDDVEISTKVLNATLEGFRLVLIGDLHELPLLHLNTTSIIVRASDWSSELQATASLTTSITYWNLTNSHWEPLIDPWPLSLSAHKDSITGALTLGLTSQERLDVNLTTTFIDLALSTATIWSKEGERLMKKARGGDAPYRIFNRTGTALQVWSDVDDKSKGGSQMQPVQLEDGSSTEWRFDDWRTMRDRVSSSNRTNSIAVQFQNKPWDAIRAIPVDREGEFVYALRPRTQKTADRLLCEVTVKDNVKHVTLRSTYKLENNTLYPIDVVLVDSRGRPSHQLKKLCESGLLFPFDRYLRKNKAPGEDYVVPIEAVLLSDIQVRPDPGFGYNWAERPIKWHDLVSDPAQTITCPYKEGGGEFPFRFQAWASYDLNDSINRAYPKMTVRLRAPIELENLLPFDIKYRIYDTTSRRTWTSYLRRGGLMPIHCVHLDHDGSPDIPVESILRVEDKQERKLDLRINYTKYEEAGGAFRMQLYSPFVAINKTGFPLNIKCRNGKPVAGQVENSNLAETTPFMFSHTKEQGAEFVFRLGDTAWSNGLNFEAPSAETAVALGSPASSTKETHIGVSWSSGLGKYKLTKVVTFAPRFVLKNELGQDIVFRESGDPGNDAPLRAGSFTPIFALSARREAGLAFKYPGVGSKWCPPVNIQDLGVVHAKLPTSDEDKPDLARIEDAPMSPKYKLEPHSQIRYAWDYPAARQKELVLRMGDGEESVNLNEIGDLPPFRFKTSSGWRVISRDIHAEDEVTVLTLSNWVEETSVYKRHGRSATMDSTISRADTVSSQAAEVGFTAVVKDVSPSLVVKIDFDGIGLSLMNRRLLEVVYLTLSKLQVTYTDSEIARDIDLACGWVQIDNQLHEAIYPIVLQPLPLTQDRDAQTVWNTVETKLTLVKDEAHGVVFIKYFGILLQALSIQTDEDFLFALLDLTKLPGASWEREETDAFSEYPKELAPPRPIEPGTTLYFEELDLNPIRLALSFARTERVNADEKLTLRNPIAVLVNALAMTLGNVNDAPLKLNGLLLRDTLLTVPGLQERIIYHYKNEVLRQLYRILGSADFIGNPVGLFTNVASGVADIITEPWQSVLNHGSKELGIGIAKGAASFAKKTVFSVSDSLTKVTGSVGKGFANATFDPEFQRQRRLAQRRNRPGNAMGKYVQADSFALSYGVQSGGEALFTSFASGLEGIVTKPFEGAERDGAIGFFKGVGKGFVGAFTKPAVGIFDLASNLAEGREQSSKDARTALTRLTLGVRNTTTVFDNNNQSRKRIPRHTPADGILTPYAQREAVGQAWMKDLNNGAYRAEFYHAHIAVPNSDVIVMLTSGHVVAFYSTKLRLKWEVAFSLIKKVSTSETGIIFANTAGPEYDQFVMIPDKGSRDWFFKEIDK